MVGQTKKCIFLVWFDHSGRTIVKTTEKGGVKKKLFLEILERYVYTTFYTTFTQL